MTVRDFVELADMHPIMLASTFIALPAVAWLIGRLHARGRGGAAPWKYVYSVLVYLACVPGMFAGVITAYTLFFSRENLMDVSLLVYFLPILSMVVTLVFVRKNVSFDEVPGFDRLSGLMVTVGVSFALALAIQKTNIWILFGGSIMWLFILATAIFVLLKWGAGRLFRSRNDRT